MPPRESTSPISEEEARRALEEIGAVAQATRRNLGHGVAAPLLILWGVIWIIGYGVSHLDSLTGAWLWPPLALAGSILSWVIGVRHASPTRDRSDGRLGIAGLVLFAFAILWVAFLAPLDRPTGTHEADFSREFARKLGAYFATVPMLGYVVAGLWLSRFLWVLGGMVTVLVAVSHFAFPAYSLLLTGFLGGGALIISGVFIKRFWH